MARILYGVQGDAGGHVNRSLTIARELKGHEVVFAGADRISAVKRHGFDVVDIPMVGTVYTDHRIDKSMTLQRAIEAVTGRNRVIDRLEAVIRDFDPDLIVTDYEYFLPLAAKRAGRPCLSIDRQHFLTNCSYDQPSGDHFGRALTLAAIRALRMTASRFFVTSFTPAASNGRWETEVFPPMIRPMIRQACATEGEDALVYLYAAPLHWIRQTFGGRKRRFFVYGQGREGEEGNLVFRPRDPQGFADDLARAAYVVSHAGSNLIAESLHLKKPLLSFPIALNYEQHLNGHLLAGTGYGALGRTRHGPAAIDAFEAELSAFHARLAGHAPWSDRSVVTRLEAMLDASAVPATGDPQQPLDLSCLPVQP